MDELKLKVTDLSKHISEPPEVKGKLSEAEKSRMANASKQFETLLTSMMLKSMTESGKGLFDDEEEKS